MDPLLEALQRITPWYQDPDQEIPEYFVIGLSPEEIETQLAVLPFFLPKEVYEIYKWCNGPVKPGKQKIMGQYLGAELQELIQLGIQHDLGIYDICCATTLFPIKEAIALWFEQNDEDEITNTWYNFPLFSHENGLLVIKGNQEQQPTSPVWDMDWLDAPLRNPIFPDLVSMMTELADTIEVVDDFWIDGNEFDKRGYWDACNRIWEKYRYSL